MQSSAKSAEQRQKRLRCNWFLVLLYVRLRYKSIFMKLFKTTDTEVVKYCQNIFRFELPSVRLSSD